MRIFRTFLFYFPRNVPEPSGRHYAVDQRKECVVLADADIVARVVHSTALADEDVARFGNLTAEEFYPQSLTFRFATVLGTTDSFLMCHFSSFLVVKH